MKPKILIAEDDPATRALLVDLLEAEGFDVDAAPNGTRAVELIRAATPDLALLDIMMPGVDGLEVLKFIRHWPPTATIPVVILTARDDDVTTWAGWTAGCDYFLSKPFEPDVLISTVTRLAPRTAGRSA
jgi:DNA-binding response OmpR family regulator